jgi:hypothetical protein
MYTPPPPPPPPPIAPPTPPSGPTIPSGPQFDFVKPFTYVFDDKEWIKKILIGGLFYLLCFVIVGFFFLGGYMARLIRNVVAGVANPLPEWDDLGEYFSEGLRLTGIGILYMLPVILGAMVFIIPGALMAGGNSDFTRNVGGGMMTCAYCIIVPLSLALSFFLPAALLRAIVLQRFGAAFEFGEIWNFIRSNFINYLLAFVVHVIANFASQLGIMLLCIGVIFTAFWSMVVAGHGFGQAWRLAQKR